MAQHPSFWQAALVQLQAVTTPELFRAWLAPIEVHSFDNSVLMLQVPSAFHQIFVKTNLEKNIASCVQAITGTAVTIQYVVGSAVDEASPPPPASFDSPFSEPGKAPDSTGQLIKATTGYIDTRHTFESFIVSHSNQFAHAAARGVAANPGSKYNPLLIYGPSGLGKTHLLHAIAVDVLKANPRARICYLSAEQFVNGFIESIQKKSVDQFRHSYRSRFDVFLIDDIQFFAHKGASEEEFFHTFNHLCGSHNQVVLTSDKPPKDLQNLEDRLVTRLQQGLVVDVKPPDLETRIAILKAKAEAEDLYMPEDVCLLIANNIRSNVRELEGALVRLSAEASINGSEITVEMAKESLSDLFNENRSNAVSIETINKAVCQYFKISAAELNSKSRARKYSGPRQIAMFLCRKYTGKTFPEIALSFGGKDHSTVMHAVEKIDNALASGTPIKKQVEEIQMLL
ncbi:MAG: chromosomal replication initiator protein DnaA [Bdellovibrionales bacterium]|nr:chromosomal replication initiator protein DnaA [Bdellovibrionales bacterium]